MLLQTLLGEIDAHEKGRTLIHKHLLFMYPKTKDDSNADFDDDGAISEAARRLIELREDCSGYQDAS